MLLQGTAISGRRIGGGAAQTGALAAAAASQPRPEIFVSTTAKVSTRPTEEYLYPDAYEAVVLGGVRALDWPLQMCR